jgi:nucleotide-binding universal stress UspA family protein
MKKIVIALDGSHFSEGAFDFARRLNDIEPILLTGVFLPQAEVEDAWAYAQVTDGLSIPVILADESRIAAPTIARFEKRCQSNGIDYRLHEDFPGTTIYGLEKESIYADLVIIGSQSFYKNRGIDTVNGYLEDALRAVKCPVITVPEIYDFPTSQVLAYDGSAASVFAIKQFAYLFPQLAKNETLLVYAGTDEVSDFPDKILIEELVARHFINLELSKLDGDPRKYFGTWLADRKDTMLVCGSYDRSWLSTLFHKAFAEEVIAGHNLPVFIAHA